MTVIAFDTLAFAKKLKDAGTDPQIAEAQAEVTAEVLQDLVSNQLVTKSDLRDLKMGLYSFIVRVAVFIVGILGGLQTLFHFVK